MYDIIPCFLESHYFCRGGFAMVVKVHVGNADIWAWLKVFE